MHSWQIAGFFLFLLPEPFPHMKKPRLYPVHREGISLILLSALLLGGASVLCFLMAASWIAWTVLGISVAILCFLAAFFRNPANVVEGLSEQDILSPANGRVVVVEPVYEDRLLKEQRLQVSIFMPVTAVHSNWYPFKGTVLHVSHRKGRYQAAYLPKSSQENESSSILIQAACNGQTVLVRQIAGAMARRIVTYAREGTECDTNTQLGFIKFGSRVDMFFPMDAVEMLVQPGDRVKGNQTVIARFKTPQS